MEAKINFKSNGYMDPLKTDVTNLLTATQMSINNLDSNREFTIDDRAKIPKIVSH